MGSINAQVVAHKISAKVRKGEKIVLADVVREAGYSHSVQRHPDRVTETQAFKKAFALEKMALIDGLQSEINRIKLAMARKNLDNEEYRVLAGSMDILTKNYQLLSGGATERQVFVLPSEVLNKNAIESQKDSQNALPDGTSKSVSKDGSIEP